MTRKKNIVRILLVILVVVVAFFVVRYLTQTRMVTISAKNISNLSIADSSKNNIAGKSYPADTQAVRVWDDKTYTVSYVGSDGYASGSISITPQTTSISIDPDYSEAKNSSLLEEAWPTILSVIRSVAPATDQYYTISRGTLMKHGEWYFTNFVYKGSADDSSSDTLTTGLQKMNGEWKVILFPDIVFTAEANKGVGRDFINAANNYRFTSVTPTEE